MTGGPLSGLAVADGATLAVDPAVARGLAIAGRICAGLGMRVLAPADAPARAAALGFGAADAAFLLAGRTPVADLAAALSGADGALLPAGVDPPRLPRATALLSMGAAAPCTEFTVMAATGSLELVGDPGGAPLRLAGHQLAHSAGLAAQTALVALLFRGAGAAPDVVEVSLAEVGLWLNWKSIVSAAVRDLVLSRAGRHAEWQVMRCKDGWVGVVYRATDWPAFKAMLDDPRLEAPRFATRALRRANAAALADILEAGLMRFTRAEIHAEAGRRRIPLGPVWSPRELFADPHYRARGFLWDGAGPVPPRLPLIWNGAAVDAVARATQRNLEETGS